MNIQEPRSQIDYMLRETRNQLVNFSQMADIKANILLSISSVLTTVAIAKLTDPTWTLPIIVLVTCLLGSIFFALLAVIPSMHLLRSASKNTKDPNFNSLFFGDYALVSYEEYLAHMEEVMNDSNRLYEVQVMEIYFAGKYLQNTKFNYIKYGYILFFIGLLSSVLIYLFQLFF
jgi:Family of unknown function (DUF5706)